MVLKVSIVGAGLGGLACALACRRQGFEVDVYEKATQFLRLGDSIGFGSNSARLLYRWGVGKDMEKIAINVTEMKVYNFDSSEKLIAVDPQLGESEAKYGCRQLIGHRGDFHLILHDHCVRAGVRVHMSHGISRYDASKPSITLESGEEIVSDVVICSDGVKSRGREAVLGYEDKPISSGYAIFRAFMPSSLIKDDPIAGKFTKEGDALRLFVAPDMHGFITTLRGGEEINAVLTHKDTGDVDEGWTKAAKKEDVLALLDGWDPAYRRVWEKMPAVIDWKLVYRPCLPKWVADSGLVTLMGDAAHPFLPTSTQGASQAIEDGATIALCLAKAGKDNIPLALHTFFQIRHDYVAEAQATGIKQRDTWHNMHDKESRQFKDTFDAEALAQGNLYLWANDAEKVVEDSWERVSAEVAGKLHI